MEHTSPEDLVAWTLVRDVPRTPGAGRRLRPVKDLRARLDSCHPIVSLQGTESTIGPREGGAGQAIGPTTSAWAPDRRRLRDTVARARRYAQALRDESGLTLEQLAAREGVTKVRVHQVLSILRLDETILTAISDDTFEAPVPTKAELAELVGLRDAAAQRARFAAWCAGEDDNRPRAARRRGFQHLFAQAREMQHSLGGGELRSMNEVARAQKVSARRVAQLLDLLTLPAEIVEVIDVPADRLPNGLTQKAVFRIAEIGQPRKQVAAFFALCGAADSGRRRAAR